MNKLTDIQQINQAVMFGNFTAEELNSIGDAIKFARAGLAKQVKRQLTLGSVVTFNSDKLGGQVSGTVEKVAVKFATVRTSRGLWRVPMNMLSVA